MGIKQFMISCMLTAIILLSTLLLQFPLAGIRFQPMMSYYHNYRPAATLPAVLPRRHRHRPYPVTFAYLISASKGDGGRLSRTLRALYHPGNYYLLHMDRGAPAAERRQVAEMVAGDPIFQKYGNVWVVKNPNLVTYRGPTMLSTTLHGMAILLRRCRWDWFINLSASDYPLITQDDLIYAFSEMPRNLNFIQHSSRLGWKLNKRGRPIVLDPAIHSRNKSDLWRTNKQRSLPTSFKLYTGSAWTVLSRSFAEYSILGWDNLPRTLLLYYTNFVSSPEFYFQTLICNSKFYSKSTVNHDLHYITWDNPPKQHPRSLGLSDYRRMVLSSRPFARKFKKDDPVLDKIDRELLKRLPGGFGYGGWCDERAVVPASYGVCPAKLRGKKSGVLRPGPGGRRVRALLSKVLAARKINTQCR